MSARLTTYLSLCVVLASVSTAAAQTAQPRLEILSRQGAYYWVVATAADGSRKGGWVPAQVIETISRSDMSPIPAQPASAAAVMSALDVPNSYDGLVLSLQQMQSKVASAADAVQGLPDAGILNQRSARIAEAIAILQSLATSERGTEPTPFTPPPPTSIRSAPSGEVEQPRPQAVAPRGRYPQTREGFWFNAGTGLGFAGCQGCVGSDAGASGGLSLGGRVSDKVLFGVGTSGWYKSYAEGVSLSGGTFDGRIRFYPSVNSGFFLTGGLGLGHISVGVAGFGSETEYGVGGLFGLGWDIRIKPNVSLTPFYNGFAVQTSNADSHVDQIGVGITVH